MSLFRLYSVCTIRPNTFQKTSKKDKPSGSVITSQKQGEDAN